MIYEKPEIQIVNFESEDITTVDTEYNAGLD